MTLEVQYRTAGSFLVSYTQNLSKGGLFLETSALQPIGTTLIVRFAVPGRSQPVECRAKVVWVRDRPTSDGKSPGLGLAFDDLDQRIGEIIDDVVRGYDGMTLMAAAAAPAIDRVAHHLCNVLSCTVVRATSPRVATALLSPEIDLVLLDLESFGAAGIPLIEAARQHTPAIPLLALVRGSEWALAARTAGASAILTQPVRHQDLRQRILELLAKPDTTAGSDLEHQ